MKRTHLYFLLTCCLLAVLSSCSTYKNSQTPDDVYYSPGGARQSSAAMSNNGEYYSTANDQYVHMLVQNPNSRWSYFNDYSYDYGGFASCFSSISPFMYYGYMPYYGGFSYWGPVSYWNSYYTWNSYYNPYYAPVIIANPNPNPKSGSLAGSGTYSPVSSPYTHLSTFSPSSYTNNIYARRNLNAVASAAPNPYSYGQTIHSNYSAGYNGSRNIYGRSNNSFYSQPSRGYTPSTFSSGGGFHSSGGFSGGGGGMGRPGRH